MAKLGKVLGIINGGWVREEFAGVLVGFKLFAIPAVLSTD